MKISEMISKLEILKERNGDSELRFTAKDYYSIYGEEININLRCGDSTGSPSDWCGSAYNGNNTTTLQFHLLEKDGKNPKITYRSK